MSNSTGEPRDNAAAADKDLSATQIGPAQASDFSHSPAPLAADSPPAPTPATARRSGPTGSLPAAAGGLSASPGGHIDRFEICSLLGKGSFGEVWKCRDPLLNRFVAIKFAKPNLAARPSGMGLFEEARKVSQLSHPGIVHIYDVINSGPQIAIVSELIDGQTLRDRLAAGPISIREVISIVRDIAAGLQHAHQHDLVHRDVKPSNILLRKNGSAALTDFGLAASEMQFEHMRDGSSGTLMFMSPEQARGDIHLLDNRSDIFCLGIVLFHCLTGRYPYPSASDKQKYRRSIATRNARPLRSIDSQLPKTLDHICARCMALDPRDRYRTAQDLVDDLEAFLASETAQLPSVPSKPRHRILVLAMAVSGLAIAAFAALRSPPADRSRADKSTAVSAAAASSAGSATTSPPIAPITRKLNEVNLLQPPEIFAWPFSDSRGIPQHSPEAQTWSVRSDSTRFLAVCGEIDNSIKELNLQVEFNLRDWMGRAGLMWGLRQNTEEALRKEYLCYVAEVQRFADETQPSISVSEVTVVPVDAVDKTISYTREITRVRFNFPDPLKPWSALKVLVKSSQMQVIVDETSVCDLIDILHPEKQWLPPGTTQVGITGEGAMVAFRRLQML